MDELIFYSFPGAIIVVSIVAIVPSIIDSQGAVILLAFLSPIIGYIIHQLHRWGFEITGGYGRKSRKAITYIKDTLAREEKILLSQLDAFLVWELSIYDSRISSTYLAHDAKSWHYLLSFWSASLASIISSVITLVGFFFDYRITLIYIFIFFVLLSIFFLSKGNNTYKSINEQEEAFIKVNKAVFEDIMKKMKTVPQEKPIEPQITGTTA